MTLLFGFVKLDRLRASVERYNLAIWAVDRRPCVQAKSKWDRAEYTTIL